MANAEIEIHGLQCDNPQCDYENKEIKFDDYPQWINAACPKCGENLLTQECFDDIMAIIETVDVVNMYSLEELSTIRDTLTRGEQETSQEAFKEVLERNGMKEIGTNGEGKILWTNKKD